jgi:hypothetical protein
MALSFLYLAFVRILQLVPLGRRGSDELAVEVVMLRHEVAVLRRQVARPCGCRKPHPVHRPGTMYLKERRYLPSDLRPAFGSTCGETRSGWSPRNPGQ